MLSRRIALVLRVGGIIFAVSALALLIEPNFFLEFLGVVTEESVVSAELHLGDENDGRRAGDCFNNDACCGGFCFRANASPSRGGHGSYMFRPFALHFNCAWYLDFGEMGLYRHRNVLWVRLPIWFTRS